jgi:recombination protein U
MKGEGNVRYGHGNRGMGLENMIEATNRSYRHKGLAVVNKRPTPVVIMKKLAGGRIEGRLEKCSTVDYDGVYRGRSLQFEAKSTRTNRLPLSNFHPHQIEHLRKTAAHGAISFVLWEVVPAGLVLYLPADVVIRAWDAQSNGGRKSIAYDDVFAMERVVRSTRGVPLDYLAVIDREVFGQEGGAA